MTRCRLYGNRAEYGGAIFAADALVKVTSTEFDTRFDDVTPWGGVPPDHRAAPVLERVFSIPIVIS